MDGPSKTRVARCATIFLSCVVARAQAPLLDLEPGSTSSEPPGTHRFVSLGDKALFTVRTSTHGDELAVTDGTASGTVVLDLEPGPLGGVGPSLGRFGDLCLFTAWRPDRGIYITDGTLAGTRLLVSLPRVGSTLAPNMTCAPLRTRAGRLMFSVEDQGASAVYSTDGTAAGTFVLQPFASGFAVARDGDAFVAASQPARVWRTDGTAGGTTLLWQGGAASFGSGSRVELAGGTPENVLYWSVEDPSAPSFDAFAMRLDSAGAAVASVLSWRELGQHELEHYGDRAFATRGYFPAGIAQHEVWVVDENPGSERLVIQAGAQTLTFSGIDAAGKRLFVGSTSGGSARFYTVWESDGTPAGSRRVWPNFLLRRLALGQLGTNRVLIGGPIGSIGDELSIYDGQSVTTFADVVPGGDSSVAVGFTVVSGLPGGPAVLFSATDPVRGREPWLLPLGTTRAANVSIVRDDACASTGREAPRLATVGGGPLAGNTGFGLQLRAPSHPTRAAAWAFGIELAPSPGGSTAGCGFPFRTWFAVPTMTDTAGVAALPIRVTTDPSVIGLRLFVCGIVEAAGGALFGVADRSAVSSIVAGG